MAGTKEIKRRIKSVKNTKKITKAMELVAASKMKRAVNATLSSRLYARYSWDLLTSLSEKLGDMHHPYFEHPEPQKGKAPRELLVLITSNRGLCGSYNSQAIKKAILAIKESTLAETTPNTKIDIITVGKKGDNAMRRLGQDIIATFIEIPDNASLLDIRPLSELITRKFKEGEYQKIKVIYTDFVSALTQKSNTRQLLPISRTDVKMLIEELGKDNSAKAPLAEKEDTEYIFEGDIHTLIESLAEKLVRMQVYQMILESNASEQSSRMLAMKNASEAAGEMIDDLTLVFNKARQASITQEISEISAGMASVS